MPTGSPLRRTKLRPPAVARDFVSRPRLRAALTPSLSAPLTLVSAPAGYGKTSLIVEFVAALDGRIAWVSLDEGDAALGAFAHAVIASLEHAVPGQIDDLEPWLASTPGPAELAARVADELDEIDDIVVLVLDELERAGSAGVHTFLEALLEYPPRSLRLVVTTRHDPPWPLESLRARGLVCEIRQADLAFTADEARGFVQRTVDLSLSDEALGMLHERTEGWPAAVRMISVALRGVSEPDEFLQHLPRGAARVEEYLAGQVLERLPEDVRGHLVRASITERPTASLCDALCTRDTARDGAAFLEYVRWRSLFIADDDGTAVRFHPLLREHLAHVLETTTARHELADLHDRARDWFDAHGDVAEAIEHALRGSRPASAADVLARHRVALMNADRQGEIASWVARVRAETGTDAFVLRLLDAWYAAPMAELPGLLDEIEGELATAREDVGVRTELQGELHVLRALDLSSRFAFTEAAQHASAALDLLPDSSTAARSLAYFAQATNAQAAGDADVALRRASAGLKEFPDSPSATASVMGAQVLVHWNEGDTRQAIQAAERALAVIAPNRAADTLALIRSMAGIARYHRNDLELAERALRGPGLHAFPSAQQALARTLEALGRPREADAVVADALERAAVLRGSDALVQGQALRAELALRRGDSAHAMIWAESLPDSACRAHSTTRSVGAVLAAVLVTAGDEGSLARADAVLDRLEEQAAQARRIPNLADVLALRACLAARRGDDAGALSALGRALALTRRGSMVRTYLDLAPAVVPYLRHPDLPPEVRAHARIVADARGTAQPRMSGHSPQVLASDLTNREEDVLVLLADRLTNKEIAQRLHIAAGTVKRHLGNVYGKLHVHGRREAVAKARALGLLPPR